MYQHGDTVTVTHTDSPHTLTVIDPKEWRNARRTIALLALANCFHIAVILWLVWKDTP